MTGPDAHPSEQPPLDPRRSRLLAGLGLHGRYLEVGGACQPLLPRREGWQVTRADFVSREELVAKYAGSPVAPDTIEPVDVVWRGGDLHECLPPSCQGVFDAIVCSHQVERVPDLVSFLASATRLVRRDGLLALAIPDKRWCYDAFRPISLAGDAVQAHHERRSRPSGAAVFNEIAYAVKLGNLAGWRVGAPMDKAQFAHALPAALPTFQRAVSAAGPLIDVHSWQFTPSSFELMIVDLSAIGWCDWQVDWIRAEPEAEFLVRLRPGARRIASETALAAHRRALLFAVTAELAAQVHNGGDDGSLALAAMRAERDALRLQVAELEARVSTGAWPPHLAATAAPTAAASAVAEAPDRRVIAVLGMHRSGTSAVTGALALAGAGLPMDLLPPRPDNPAGFFEAAPLVALHDELLGDMGLTWDDPAPLTAVTLARVGDRATIRLARALAPHWRGQATLVVKDPRLCRVFPIWERLCAAEGLGLETVLVIRHPLEVADSLRVRHGMARERALALWLRYLLDAERATRGRPRHFVDYSVLLRDRDALVLPLARRLGLATPGPGAAVADRIARFLEPALQHHHRDFDELAANDLPTAIRSAYLWATAAATQSDLDTTPMDDLANLASAT